MTHTFDYCGNMVYEDSELSYILNPAGRALPATQAHQYIYEYFLTDHLGNVRVVYGDPDRDHEAEVIQENSYYPYGMTMGGLNYVAGLENRYLYQGKETSGDFGLWWSDFHARRFDSQLGRWHSPDPAGQFASPYVGMGNNPVIAVDPDGRWADRIKGITSTGFELYRYAQWLNRNNYKYVNGLFLQPTVFPIEFQDPFRDGMNKRREAEQEQVILLEKLGLNVEIIGGSIIIDYYYHNDGPGEGIFSRSFTLSQAVEAFDEWLDNEATMDQYNAFFDLFQNTAEQAGTLPDFATLWSNYPHDINGQHQHPSSDSYAKDQCAIRVGLALQLSGVDMSSYPGSNKTSEGYPRYSKGLADWLWREYGKPKIVSQSTFESNYWDKTGIIYIAPPPGGMGHIDLFNQGTTGSGYYLGSEIWFWYVK